MARAETRRLWAGNRAGVQGSNRLQGLAGLPLGSWWSSLRDEAALSCLPGTKGPLEISSQLLILPRASGWSPFHSKASLYTPASGGTPCLKNFKSSGEATFCFFLRGSGGEGLPCATRSCSHMLLRCFSRTREETATPADQQSPFGPGSQLWPQIFTPRPVCPSLTLCPPSRSGTARLAVPLW